MKPFAHTDNRSHAGTREFLRTLNERLETATALHYVRQSQVWIVLALASLALMWGGMKLGDRFGLLIGFLLALGFNALVIFYDQWRVNSRFSGPELEGRDPWGCLSTARELVQILRQTASFPMPIVRKIENETPLILASGLTSSRLQVIISTGAIEKLEPRELRAAMAFQLMRFHTNQLRVATAAAALADLVLTFAASLDAAFFLRIFLGREPRRCCPGPISWLVRPFAIAFLRLVIPRKSILALDHLTAQTFDCGPELAQTLIKLDAYNKTMPADVNYAEASLAIVDPLAGISSTHWASVQPPIRKRIDTLTGRFPL